MTHVYCTECGFQNPETANYCSRCGALLEKGESAAEVTQTFAPEEVVDSQQELVEGLEGPALVVRFGGGRAGESFLPAGPRTRIGRSPECEIFLDDVTVSRNHAVLHERGVVTSAGATDRDGLRAPGLRRAWDGDDGSRRRSILASRGDAVAVCWGVASTVTTKSRRSRSCEDREEIRSVPSRSSRAS